MWITCTAYSKCDFQKNIDVLQYYILVSQKLYINNRENLSELSAKLAKVLLVIYLQFLNYLLAMETNPNMYK